jgi:predicted CXXCH cytochrome family protein
MKPFLAHAALAFLLGFLTVLPSDGECSAVDERPYNVLYPLDRSLYGGAGIAHIVIELNEKGASLTVRVNGKLLENPKIKDKIYHYAASLAFGLNQVEVEVFSGSKPLGRETQELFFFSPLAKIDEVPREFTRAPFHLNGRRPEKCVLCHVLDPQKDDVAPAKPAASSCYSCHQGLIQYKQVHGPASLWHCLRCHEPDSAPARYATPVPVRNLCWGCHADQKEYFLASAYQHGPTATGMCTICHNPHASDNEFWLKKQPWDLCTTCHAEKASGRHVIAWGPSGQTHPTRGRPDPKKPEREFSCRSCHNPHASNMPKLWNYNVKSYFELCQVCHNK